MLNSQEYSEILDEVFVDGFPFPILEKSMNKPTVSKFGNLEEPGKVKKIKGSVNFRTTVQAESNQTPTTYSRSRKVLGTEVTRQSVPKKSLDSKSFDPERIEGGNGKPKYKKQELIDWYEALGGNLKIRANTPLRDLQQLVKGLVDSK